VGVVSVEGGFPGGVAVEVLHQKRLIAKGLTSMSAADIARVRGVHSSVAGGEVIHRDDLVLLT
jgi:glutamate 5-kinase